MKTLPHHNKARLLAAAMFSDSARPEARPAMSRMSVTVPTGALMAVDAVAQQLTGGNRSQAVANLLELGYGLLMEHLPEDQRAYMQELAAQQAPADVVEGDE